MDSADAPRHAASCHPAEEARSVRMVWNVALMLAVLIPVDVQAGVGSFEEMHIPYLTQVVNQVEYSRVPDVWDPAPQRTATQLFPENEVRVGRASSALIVGLLGRDSSSLKSVELGPVSRFQIPRSGQPVRLREGLFHFFSRSAADLWSIGTEAILGAVRGTEFMVEVRPDGYVLFRVLQGRVDLQRIDEPEVPLPLLDWQAAEYDPNTRVLRRIPFLDLRLEGLAQTFLYYPGVLNLDDLGWDRLSASHVESARMYMVGDLTGAVSRAPWAAEPSSDGERLYRAFLLLAVGDVSAARAQIQALSSTAERPQDPRLAAALRTMLAAAIGGAVERETPQLATEWLAESYYQQSLAGRSIARATPSTESTEVSSSPLGKAMTAAKRATELAPTFGYAWVRYAEMAFGFGHAVKARDALEMAQRYAPQNAQASALRGFVDAARPRWEPDTESFRRAVALDPRLANGWLGLGLSSFRRGNSGESGLLRLLPHGHSEENSEGLQLLEQAAAREPDRSLLRSYLGKAYHDSAGLWGGSRRLGVLAREQLDLARRLDTNDPTPYLYSALILNQANRPNDAIRSLETSLALNDRRQAFRSRFLLDQDRAVRAANLASLYADAGLVEFGQLEATAAVDADYANPAAHLFLANAYNARRDPTLRNLRYESATTSEYLLANILGAVGSTPLSPVVSQQEYGRLLERDHLGFVLDSSYRSSGDISVQGAQYGIIGPTAYALEGSYRTLNGPSEGPLLDQRYLSLQFKQQIGPRDDLYFQVVRDDARSDTLTPTTDARDQYEGEERREVQEPVLLAGLHRAWHPGSHTLALLGYLDSRMVLRSPNASFETLLAGVDGSVTNSLSQVAESRGWPSTDRFAFDLVSNYQAVSAELQHILRLGDHTLVAGARFQAASEDNALALSYRGWDLLAPLYADLEPGELSGDFTRSSVYVYDTWQVIPSLALIGGVTFDWIRFPDTSPGTKVDVPEVEHAPISPKVGIRWNPVPRWTLRGAYGQSLIGFRQESSLSVEPTAIAGFNQAYRSVAPPAWGGTAPGSDVEMIGAGVEWKPASDWFIAASWQRLAADGSTHQAVFAGRSDEGFVPASTFLQSGYEDDTISLSADRLLGSRWGIGVTGQWIHGRFDTWTSEVSPALWPSANRSGDASAIQALGRVQYHDPSGWFARLEADWLRADEVADAANQDGGKEDALRWNAHAGYRFAQRRVEISAGILNMTNARPPNSPLAIDEYLSVNRSFYLRARLHLR